MRFMLAIGPDNNCVQSGLPALGELSLVYLDNSVIARPEQCDRQAETSDRESCEFKAGFLCYPVSQASDICSGSLTPIQTRRAQLARDASTLSGSWQNLPKILR